MKFILFIIGIITLINGFCNPYLPIRERLVIIAIGASFTYVSLILLPNSIINKIKRKRLEKRFIEEERMFKNNSI